MDPGECLLVANDYDSQQFQDYLQPGSTLKIKVYIQKLYQELIA